MNKTRRKISIGILVGALAALIPAGARAATPPPIGVFDVPCASSSGVGDFNGDGYKDLAIGAPGDSIGGKSAIDGSTSQGSAAAGSVNVVYGSAKGLDPKTGAQFFNGDNLGLADLIAETGDTFGYSVVAGNFDGVGGSDLAIGIPGKDGQAGEVVIIYSQPGTGLNPTTAEIWKPGFNGMKGTPQAGAEFGFSLAAGNFNGDDADDLSIGAPKYDVSGAKDAGQGWIIAGIKGVGLVGLYSTVFTQATGATTGPKVEAGNFFTGSLAAGDLNSDALNDLAAGAPGDDIGSAADGGSVEIRFGDANKPLYGPKPAYFFQGNNGVNGTPQTGARWGCALAAADFNRDLFAGQGLGKAQDLAVGAPGYKVGAETNAGAVSVIYNTDTATGLSAVDVTGRPAGSKWRDDQLFTQDTAGVPGVATKDDRFGASLAAGDFDNTLAFGLAIGEPTATLYKKTGAGSVRVLHGSSGKGITTTGASAFAQSPAPATDACYLYNLLDQGCGMNFIGGPTAYSALHMVVEKDDHFGQTLAAGDFNKDGKTDLSIGVPNEAYGEFFNWITEEQGEIGPEFLKDLGVPVPLSIDEQVGAGILQVVNGGSGAGGAAFPTGTATPADADQHIIVRLGTDVTQGLGEGIRGGLTNIPGFVDANQIPANNGQSKDLTGDGFGGAQG